MNRLISTLRLLALTLAALLCLCGCGGTGAAQPVNDERAAALAKELKANPCPFFPRIEGVDTLPSALCVVVTVDKVAYFLQDDALPTCAPEAAEAVLLAQMNTVHTAGGKQEGVYNCDLIYGTPDGSLSVTIAKGLRLEKGDTLPKLLKARFTFAEGEKSLPRELVAYGEKLKTMDFQTPIDACRGDYDNDHLGLQVKKEQFGEPLVYLTDADYVCEPVPGNDLFSHPAEKNQFVPDMTQKYERPPIGGAIGLGFAGLGKPDDTPYTLAEVQERLAAQPDAFCLLEIVGLKPFGTFKSSDGKSNFTAITYQMRFSLIGFDGQLLGHWTVHYDGSGLTNLEKQFIGNQLSVNKYGQVVLPWSFRPYREAFWKFL